MRLFFRLAVQNLARRPARAFLLALIVAVGVGAAFATCVVQRAIDDSLSVGFARMGADLVVVPRDTLVNLTPALLTVEPTPHVLEASTVEQIARVAGIEAAAPQRYIAAQLAGDAHAHDADLIAFDPARDFTVLPWLAEKLDRPLAVGEVLVGARREQAVGSTVQLGGRTFTVRGRLGLTGVGPFDRGFFTTFESAADLVAEPGQVSAVLIRLKGGATPEQVRFALAQVPGLKVVAGPSLYTSVRQGLTAVLSGAVALTLLVLLAAVLMVGVLYSAVLAERRRELGLLLALGTRRRQLLRLILVEAMLTTGLGGICGALLGGGLLLLFERSLGHYLQSASVPLVRPGLAVLGLYALAGIALAACVGLVGAIVPAWRVSRQEVYDLVRAEGH
jgi:putative ABC transport system permease protein